MTILINLYGAPGSGKSTTAAYTFAMLKYSNINAELVREYAKELCWKGELTSVDQLVIYIEQESRLMSLNDKVDVAISDSPLSLSAYYGDSTYYKEKAIQAEKEFKEVVNVLVVRDKPYNPSGRLQTEAESDKIAQDMETFTNYDLVISGTTGSADTLTAHILSILEQKNKGADTLGVTTTMKYDLEDDESLWGKDINHSENLKNFTDSMKAHVSNEWLKVPHEYWGIIGLLCNIYGNAQKTETKLEGEEQDEFNPENFDVDIERARSRTLRPGVTVPPEFGHVIKVLEMGIKKGYEPNGWLTDPESPRMSHKENSDSMFHHLADHYVGITKDHESGLHPLLHLAARALMGYTRYVRGIKSEKDI